MLERLGEILTRVCRRWLPSPFVLAVLLTALTLAAALVHTGFDARRVLFAWIDGAGQDRGFWGLLGFAMQMALILVTGHALAASPPVRRGLARLADVPRTPAAALAVVAVGAMLLGLVNWGLGLIAGALLAREVGRRAHARGVAVHYPLLAAAGYAGMLVWHGGLSASAPLKVTLESDLREVLGPALAAAVGPIPLDRTIGAWPNLAASALLLLLVPWVLVRMQPRDPAARRAPPPTAGRADDPGADTDGGTADAADATDKADDTPAARLGRSRALAWGTALVGLTTWALVVGRVGLDRLDPNLVNFVFLFVGIGLHGSLAAYGRAVDEAARGAAGILLQFPFYAGIMGLLAGTGLLAALSDALAQVGAAWLPAVSFYSAGLVNLFVPSGGGQWAVQGPPLMEAAVAAGVDPARLVMALAYGDQWTNMLQPFWALPLLAITGVRAREVIGYTAVLTLVSQAPFVAALYVGW